jgi:GDPmannose 4,6-dehydratase
MKALIFGISGQDGFYLRELCLKQNIEVVGVSRSLGEWIQGSVSDFSFVENLIKEEKPDYIFHFAANSTTRHDAIFENHEAIGTGTINILEACKRYSRNSRVFISGSALQFCNSGEPINETVGFSATSPYVISRNYSVYAARYYRGLGLKVYVGYFFHHDSPLRSTKHINAKIVDCALSNYKGIHQELVIGNSSVVKEYNFAGDFMEAIWLMVNQDKVSELVIGSGQGYSIAHWLEICFDLVGLNWKDYVSVPDNFKADFDSLVSDPKELYRLGWKPKVDINDLAKMMMAQ